MIIKLKINPEPRDVWKDVEGLENHRRGGRLTVELARKLFEYKNGRILWKVDVRGNAVKGALAALEREDRRPTERRFINFHGKYVDERVVVYALVKGVMIVSSVLKSKDGDNSNCNINNLYVKKSDYGL